ncbi:MAG TPA: hypothetical protein VE978_20075 [Chitinophagales bacterium]|nr:hypothetical protein [Chitinophagales bacterium]
MTRNLAESYGQFSEKVRVMNFKMKFNAAWSWRIFSLYRKHPMGKIIW